MQGSSRSAAGNALVVEQLGLPWQRTVALTEAVAPASTPMTAATAAAQFAPPGTHLFTGAPSSTMALA